MSRGIAIEQELTEGNIAQWLSHWAAERPHAPFFKCSGDWQSYGQMHDVSGRVAAALANAGLERGDRLAVFMESRDEYIVMAVAAARCGAIFVPLNKYLKGEFLRAQLANSGARFLCVDDAGLKVATIVLAETSVEFLITVDANPSPAAALPIAYTTLCDCAQPVPKNELAAGDPAAIIYTSGTTGPSKGCVQPYGYLAAMTASARQRELIVEGDRVFSTLPLFHAAGLVLGVYTPLRNGDSVVVRPEFRATNYIRDAMQEGATMLMGVGAIGVALLAQPTSSDPPNASFRVAAIAPLTVPQQQEFARRFRTQVFGGDGYGQTECSPITGSRLSGRRKMGTIGEPQSHLDVRLFNEQDEPVGQGVTGEIVVRPKVPFCMYSGYWNDPDATVKAWRNLWHHTGDYGWADADGFITFVGRKVDAIRRRGENISALEVEKAICGHPSVREVAVHAVPGDLGEDDIKAVIVLETGEQPLPAALFDFFKVNLPYFAVPRFVEFMASLPKTEATGRVKKHELRFRGVTSDTWDFTAMGHVIGRAERRALHSFLNANQVNND